MLKPQHIQQRHLDHHRTPLRRMLRHLHTHQQPAVRPTHNPQVFRRRNLPRNQVLPNRIKIVIDPLPMRLQPGLMPRRPKLSTAANIRQHKHPAMLQPQLADIPRVARRLRHLEPAIRIQQRRIRAVILHVLAMHHKVRHLRAILRRRLQLLHHIQRCIKQRRLRLRQRHRSRPSITQPHRRGRQKSRNP